MLTLAYPAVMRNIAAVLVLVATLLIGTGTPTMGRDDTPMTVGQAGKHYLRGACREAASDVAYFRGVYRGRKTIYLAEIDRRLPAITRLARKNGQAAYAFAKSLLHPPAPWPDGEIANLASKLADRVLRYSDARRAEGSAQTGRQWIRLSTRADQASEWRGYPAQIRARLDLPPPGEGC